MRSLLLVLFLIAPASAQCVNGVCQVPMRSPVVNTFKAVARPVVSVAQAQPVRSTVGVVVRSAVQIPQVVRHEMQHQSTMMRSRQCTPMHVHTVAPLRRVVVTRPRGCH